MLIAMTKVYDFLKAAKEIKDDKVREVLSELGNFFNNDPIWQKDGNLEIDIEKFFGSFMFKSEKIQDQDKIDWKMLTLFAIFTCK